jgi:O-phosphoseryl-tRNA(Cys) synthetase
MNIHNLSKIDLLTLKNELTQYKLGNITTEQLSPELTEILNAVKQVTVHS